MKDFFKGKIFKVVLCVLAVILGIMIYQAASGNYASVPEAIVGTVVSPVVRFSSAVSDKVAGFFNMLLNAQSTSKENEELRKELAEAYDKLSDFETYKNENAELKKFLEIKEKHPDYKMESAQVIGRDSSNAFAEFTLNKGSINGIEVNDPVITSEGLVGIVSHVGPTYSIVTTILDPEINIGVYNSRTQETGVVSGDAAISSKGKTKLRLLPRNTALLSGDIIETSGIGGIFPEGILLGTIEVIKAENSGVSMYAEIKPVAPIEEVSNVMILTDFSVKVVEPVVPETEENVEEEENSSEIAKEEESSSSSVTQ